MRGWGVYALSIGEIIIKKVERTSKPSSAKEKALLRLMDIKY